MEWNWAAPENLKGIFEGAEIQKSLPTEGFMGTIDQKHQ